ncbi:toprim domain-containing protein [Maribacter arcticus]|uniref:toprim domain-containing protein n=1 Tax=Maribacter arcticus TaxID=561365 RepID=UPI001F2F47CD|nr:toprim domain-containing protein [Maribacter arcticus]
MSKKLNRWYDHGEGTGGNVIDLVCKITKSSVKETLRFLEQDRASFSFQQRPVLSNDNHNGIQILHARPTLHYGLLQYLFERRISISTASAICMEVHYLNKGRRYFAIGLKNVSGGWELRNKYYKNSSSPKDITHIKNGIEKLIVTEGMFDLLSILEGTEESNLEYDFLVLNSTAFVSKAIEIMKGYLQIDLYLDNDSNGRRTTQKLMAHSINCLDKSMLYEGFKDMNEWLIYNAKKRLGQEARDVSLLPQKQTRFTPDGRKVKKK